MEYDMININGNLVGEIQRKKFQREDGTMNVANFTLLTKEKKGEEKKKKYIYCNVYGEKAALTEELRSGDFIHVYGYWKETQKGEKTYRNFIVKHVNRLEKEKHIEEEKE